MGLLAERRRRREREEATVAWREVDVQYDYLRSELERMRKIDARVHSLVVGPKAWLVPRESLT